MIKPGYFLVAGLLLAAAVTWMIGEQGFNLVKISGIGLSLFAFLPVFFLLNKSLKSKSVTTTLAYFVGGFFFKLAVLLMGVWYSVSKPEFDEIEFIVSSMVFILIFQIYESVYFWSKHQSSSN